VRQEHFEAIYGSQWRAFEEWLAQLQLNRRARREAAPPFPAAEIPRRYREICRHLALARSRDYGTALVERLHRLAVEGHDALYGTPSGIWLRVRAYLLMGFARDVRRLRAFVYAALLLLFVPYLGVELATRADPDFAYFALPPRLVWKFEEMYGARADRLGRARDAGTDVAMFGHYIRNNIGIAFRCYAGGVLAGVGTSAALIYNGVFMGAVEGRVVAKGYGENFFSFVAGHSAFELFAIVLSGACGLRLGWALLAPGRKPRSRALRLAAEETAGVILGAALMLLVAAAIEAFWSPLRLPALLKYAVGMAFAAFVAGYFLFAGRTDESR
jgi:uncharacterized membrane protein SpoIIM required for sporulation